MTEITQQEKTTPIIALEELAGCAGELLVILENLDKILPFARLIRFRFGQSRNETGPVDVAFVEGSVSQPHDLEKLKWIRENSRILVAVGNCAVWGNVQGSCAAKHPVAEMLHAVYGEDTPIEALPSAGLDNYVKVDVKLSGCPISATQVIAVAASVLRGHLPYVVQKPVCLECKYKENVCVLVEYGLPCIGPVTAAGCGALCPSLGAACYGCWGISENPQIEAMTKTLTDKGYSYEEVRTRLTSFGASEQLFARKEPQPAAPSCVTPG